MKKLLFLASLAALSLAAPASASASVAVSPPMVIFGTVPSAGPPVSQTVKLTISPDELNRKVLSITSRAFPASPDPFSSTHDCPAVFPPGLEQSCTITVTFDPKSFQKEGNAFGEVVIHLADPLTEQGTFLIFEMRAFVALPVTPIDESACEGGPACSGGSKGKGTDKGKGKGAGKGNGDNNGGGKGKGKGKSKSKCKGSAKGKSKCKGKGKGKGKGQGADRGDSAEEKGTCKVSAGAAKPDPAKGGFYFPASFHCTGTAKRILFSEGLIRRDPTSPACLEHGCTAAWGGLNGGYSFPDQILNGPEHVARLLRKSWEGEFFAPCAGYATDYGPSWVVQEVNLMNSGARGGHRAFSKPLERAKSPEASIADLCPQL